MTKSVGKNKFSFTSLGLLDNGDDGCLENIASLAAKLLDANISLVSVILFENELQYISASNLACLSDLDRSIPFDQSICKLVCLERKPVIIENLSEDNRSKHLNALRNTCFQSYVGVPFHSGSGETIGSLCCVWTARTSVDSGKVELLQRLARGVDDIIRARATVLEKEKTNAKLEKLLSARSGFISHLSHEIRTPLTGLMGSIKLLTTMDLDEKPRELVQLLDRSSARLLEVVNDTLDLAKLDSGYVKLNEEPCDLGELARAIVDFNQVLTEGKDLAINVIDNLGGEKLIADKNALKSIIYNLFSNAVKFTSKGSAEIILSRNIDEWIEITVADTGIGIEQESHATIFDEFQQANPRIARKYGGTGLGMAIVKRFVDLMHGEIGLESEIGKGTKVTITLPLKSMRLSHLQEIQ